MESEEYRGSLTVKLRGRPEAPNWSRGCTLSSRTCGDATDSHGPLRRLLDGALVTTVATPMATPVISTMISKMSVMRIAVTT